jgi:hypothetical protein
MHRLHTIWFGVGFSLIPFFVLFLGYLNIHPEIHRSIPSNFAASNDATFSSIAWDEDEKGSPPLEYVSDAFNGISISTQAAKVASFWDLWNKPNSQVEYEWRYKVKNLTETKLTITVTYTLLGENNVLIASSDASEIAEPGETIEIKKIDSLDYNNATRVSASSWSIRRREIP